MPSSLYKSTVSSTIKMLMSSVAVFILQFTSTIILARLYSPGEFGVLSKITIVTSFADVFCQLGLGAAIVQKSDCNEYDYQTVSFTSFVLGLVTTLVVFFLSSPIADIVRLENETYLKLIAPAFLIISLSVLPIARAQREMRFNVIVLKDVISYFGYLVICVFLGVFEFGIWGLIIGLLARYIISTVVSIIAGKCSLKMKFHKESFCAMFKFGLGFSLCKICSVATDQSDYYAIARTLNDVALGLYNKAFQLISTPISLIGQAIDQVFFSSFSKIKDDEKRIGELFVSVSAMVSIACLISTTIVFYFSGFITKLLFGTDWIEAAIPISILSLGMFCRASIKITDPIMRAKGYVYQRASFHCINTITTVIAALLGSSQGLFGVSLGVVLAQFVNYLINTIYVSIKLRINMISYIRATASFCVLTILVCLFGIVSSSMDMLWIGSFDIKSAYIILISFAFCIIVFCGLYSFVLQKEVKDELHTFIKTLFSLFKRKQK